MSLIDTIHGGYVFHRRVRVLCRHLAGVIPPNASVLDVGCGDGSLARLIGERRNDVRITGIDVLVRPQTHVPVTQFDGRTIPFGDASHDVVMFVDVLHHTEDPRVLLKEARRVARQVVIIKDHHRDGLLAWQTLRFMDWVGNARHGVVLPYNYWSSAEWTGAFRDLDMKVDLLVQKLGLYPWPASWVFERWLHFVARLDVAACHESAGAAS
jgi:SAM-dependent methyltransferase